ncbi:hypothetical protein K1W69_12610 [Hoeflea sp. WL0058]|uniref:Uncharacterized protein n=1 Tax=Flavimaribacter sediminis TaxID=2865987 RepID=A0AAE3D035_9HYPH|nr:hypothetical protein [Flavimaribacter sediminis]MBW8638030.1 hypothetical protein [Flavimaribacter sediminis]
MRTRTLIAAVIALPLNAVLFGTGAAIALSLPYPEEYLKYVLPAVILLSLIVTVPVAWKLAPRLRVRNDYYPALFKKPS